MIYNLKNEFQLLNFKSKCEYYINKGVIVELKLKPESKTYPQLKYMHILLRYVACETGYDEDYIERNYFKIAANKDIFVQEIADRYTNKVCIALRSCATLTKEEMTTAIERFRNWASMTVGIYLPEPYEGQMLAEVESMIEKNKEYL